MNQSDQVSLLLAQSFVHFSIEQSRGRVTDGKGWKHNEWRATFIDGANVRQPSATFTYRTGMGIKGKPSAADVLHCLILDSDGCAQPFEDWCADYGYDSDSRKALAVYLECQENARKLRTVIDQTTLDALRNVLRDY